MVKCEVIEGFTLAKFDELEDLQRANSDRNKKGELFVGDTFACTEDMANYLVKDNAKQKAFIRIIEVIPEEEKVEESDPILKTTLDEEEVKPKKRTTRRKRLD